MLGCEGGNTYQTGQKLFHSTKSVNPIGKKEGISNYGFTFHGTRTLHTIKES